MRAGDLRHRIELQEKITVKDSEGYDVAQWTAYATVHASKKGIRGREYFAAAAVQAENSIEWQIRFRKDVTDAHRVYDIENQKSYDIRSVVPIDDKKSGLALYTQEVDASAG